MKNLIYSLKPPCPQCPYKLGLVQTLANPCPQCRENGYQMYTRFKKQHQEQKKNDIQ